MAPASQWSKVGGLAIWPINHIVGMLTLKDPTPETIKEIKPSYTVKPYHRSAKEWIEGSIRLIPFFTITLICNVFYPISVQIQESSLAVDAFIQGNRDPLLQLWIMKIAARDLIVGLTVCIVWQWTVIHSPMAKKLRPLKFNKKYAEARHVRREMVYSVSTILCGTFWEVLIMVMYANGYCSTLTLDVTANWHKILLMILVTPIWRNGYFYWCHRVMHNWETKRIPDIGKWLYNNAHYLHHQSRNIQPWSGISMHPIEGIIYESAIILPLLFTHHPIMYNLVKIDLNLSAVLGHDGHEYPATGNWYHFIHHVKINWNYGSENMPFDWLFGSLDTGDDLLKGDIAANTLAYEKELEEEASKKIK